MFRFETFPTTYEERSRLDVVYGALRRLAAAAFPILKFETLLIAIYEEMY